MKTHLTSLPLQLLGFVVLPLLVLLIGVAFGGVALHQSEMQTMLSNHNRQVVSGTADSLSQQLEQRQQLLTAPAIFSALASTLNEPSSQIDWLNGLFDGGMALYSQDGQLLNTTLDGIQWESIGGLLRADDQPVFLSLITPGQNITQIAIVAPTQGDDQLYWVVGIVSLESMPSMSVIASLHESNSTAIYLLGNDNIVLYHSNPRLVGDELDWTSATEDSDTVVTVAPVSVARWKLIQTEQWKETIGPIMRYSQATPLVLVPALLIAIIAVWFVIEKIVYPLQSLEGQASGLSTGNYDSIKKPIRGIQEIQHLQTVLQNMARHVQAAQENMRDYIGAITRAQEDERQRLARELHDQTAQALVALDHRQQMLKPYLKDEIIARELLSEVRTMIANSLEDLRRIVRALRPTYLEELGLAPALKMLAHDLGLADLMTIHFHQDGSPQRLAPEHEIALYRIAQEALNNAWQHSQATEVRVTVIFTEVYVSISVQDNGIGYEMRHRNGDMASDGRKHFGIMGMVERASLIGAQLQIHSVPNQGTLVKVQASLPQE